MTKYRLNGYYTTCIYRDDTFIVMLEEFCEDEGYRAVAGAWFWFPHYWAGVADTPEGHEDTTEGAKEYAKKRFADEYKIDVYDIG